MADLLNFQASGKASDIDGELARRIQPADDNPHQTQFKALVRDFVKRVMSLFGPDSNVTILHNGSMDHGGGDMTMTMAVQNLGGNPLAKEYEIANQQQASATPFNARSDAQHELAGTSATQPAPSPVETPDVITPTETVQQEQIEVRENPDSGTVTQ